MLDSVRMASWEPAKLGRFQCVKDYPFHAAWNGVYYTTKRVQPIFAEELEEIVVVTVYSYYFQGGPQ